MASLKMDEPALDKLAEILKKHDLREIEYKKGDTQIRVVAHSKNQDLYLEERCPQRGEFSQRPDPSPKAATSEETVYDVSHEGAVKSPMVGTCYLAPEPGAKNFVNVGDVVQENQSLLIIEAMKVMNLIKSPKAGKVVHIAVTDASPVEYGQLLMVIE